jgi:hypothetical protein
MNKHLAVALSLLILFCPAIARCDTEQDKAAIRDLVGTQQAAPGISTTPKPTPPCSPKPATA